MRAFSMKRAILTNTTAPTNTILRSQLSLLPPRRLSTSLWLLLVAVISVVILLLVYDGAPLHPSHGGSNNNYNYQLHVLLQHYHHQLPPCCGGYAIFLLSDAAPVIVSSATTYTNGGFIPEYVFDVVAMLNTANGISKAATALLIDPTIQQPLTIEGGNETSWPANLASGVFLNITIVRPRLALNYLDYTMVYLFGTLRSGSVVNIMGGTLEWSAGVIKCVVLAIGSSSPFELIGGSKIALSNINIKNAGSMDFRSSFTLIEGGGTSVLVSGCHFSNSPSFNGGNMRLLVTKDFNMTQGSTFSIINNVGELTPSGGILNIFGLYGAVGVLSGSILNISGNNISGVYSTLTPSTTSSVFASVKGKWITSGVGSQCLLKNNTFTLDSLVPSSNVFVSVLLAFETVAEITQGGAFSVSNNTLLSGAPSTTTSNFSLTSTSIYRTLLVKGFSMTISDDVGGGWWSSVQFSHNYIEVGARGGMSASRSEATMITTDNTITIGYGCAVDINHNVILVSIVGLIGPTSTILTHIAYFNQIYFNENGGGGGGAVFNVNDNSVTSENPLGRSANQLPTLSAWLHISNFKLISNTSISVSGNSLVCGKWIADASGSEKYPVYVSGLATSTMLGPNANFHVTGNIVNISKVGNVDVTVALSRYFRLFYCYQTLELHDESTFTVTQNTVDIYYAEIQAKSAFWPRLVDISSILSLNSSLKIFETNFTIHRIVLNSTVAYMLMLVSVLQLSTLQLRNLSRLVFSSSTISLPSVDVLNGNLTVYSGIYSSSCRVESSSSLEISNISYASQVLTTSGNPLAVAVPGGPVQLLGHSGLLSVFKLLSLNSTLVLVGNILTVHIHQGAGSDILPVPEANVFMLGFQRTADIGEGSTLIFTNNTLDVLHTRTATSTTPVVDVFLVVKAIAFLTNISGVVSQANIDAMSVIQITSNTIVLNAPTFVRLNLLSFDCPVSSPLLLSPSSLSLHIYITGSNVSISTNTTATTIKPPPLDYNLQSAQIFHAGVPLSNMSVALESNTLEFPSLLSPSSWVASQPLLPLSYNVNYTTCSNVYNGGTRCRQAWGGGGSGGGVGGGGWVRTQYDCIPLDLNAADPTVTIINCGGTPTSSTTHTSTISGLSITPSTTTSTSRNTSQTPSLTHRSDTLTHTSTAPTPSTSKSITKRNFCLSPPTCHVVGAVVVSAARTNVSFDDIIATTPSTTCTSPEVTIGYGMWSTSGAQVIVTLSGEAALGAVPKPRNATTTESLIWQRVGSSQSAVEYAILEIGRNDTSSSSSSSSSLSATAWCVMAVRYVGTASLVGTTATLQIPMGVVLGGCRVGTPGASDMGLVYMLLDDSPPLPPNVGAVVDAGVVVTAVTGSVSGVPSGLIQSGIANAMVGMLRCSEFDPEEEVDFVSNPGGWAVGRTTLQYQRGSLLLVIIIMGCVLLVAGCVVLVLYLRGDRRKGGWMVAIGEARLPSLLVIPVLVSSSMGLPSGTTILFYTDDSSAVDYVLAVVVMVPMWGYLLLFAYRSTYGMRVELAPIPQPPPPEQQQDADEASGATSRSRSGKGRSGLQRVARFMMEPTFGPIVPTVRARTFNANVLEEDDGDAVRVVEEREDPEAPEPWLRRNYFFVADRRWAGYGGVEAIVGSLVDMLEGIPVTTRSVPACIARPAAMCFLLVIMLLLLVFKWPNSVRFQQYSALSVTALLLVANVLVVINAAIVAPDLEAAAGQLIGVVSLIIVILSMLDLLATLASIIPALRRSMGISGTSLTASIGRLRAAIERKKEVDRKDTDALLLQQPLLPPAEDVVDGSSASSSTSPSETGSTTSSQKVKHSKPQKQHDDSDDSDLKLKPVYSPRTTEPREDIDGTPSPRALVATASSSSSPPTTTSIKSKGEGRGRGRGGCLPGMYRDLGDADAYAQELEAMRTDADIEAERMRLFTEEVMRDL